MISKSDKTQKYLDKNVFYGLKNLNNGFDVASIKYFSESDFEIVLDRIEKLKCGITGIEPWKNGLFYGVITYEMRSESPFDSKWYREAFEEFKREDKTLQYAASYSVPKELLEDL